jgi:HSP20 family molecular chaperone IbpA
MTEINKNSSKSIFEKIKSHCKSFNPSKTFIAASCILIGIGATLIAQNITQRKNNYYLSRSVPLFFHHDNFFESDHIFAEIALMEQSMDEAFKRMRMPTNQSSQTYPNQSEVLRQEDENYYIYQLNFSGYKPEEVVVSVKNNVVSFFAEKKQSDENKKPGKTSTSSFNYSFSAPQYDTKKEPEIIKKDGSITVKLSKKKN